MVFRKNAINSAGLGVWAHRLFLACALTYVHICNCSCLPLCVPSSLPSTIMSKWSVNNNNHNSKKAQIGTLYSSVFVLYHCICFYCGIPGGWCSPWSFLRTYESLSAIWSCREVPERENYAQLAGFPFPVGGVMENLPCSTTAPEICSPGLEAILYVVSPMVSLVSLVAGC